MFARYQRSEQALVIALMEMVINGVSTRKVAQITEELCGTACSKSTVSALCKRLDPIVEAWNHRHLREKRYPFVLVEALGVRIREDGRVRPRAVMIAGGINEDGYREIVGLMVGDSESEASWRECLAWLKSRDLRGLDIVVSDSPAGLVRALQAEFQGCTWQRCQTHFRRTLLDATPKSLHEEVYKRVRAILAAPDIPTARLLTDKFVGEYAERAPQAVQVLEDGFDDVPAVLALPDRYRRRLRTTNGVERLNEEIRRRERVIRIFPTRESVPRLVGALLMERDETWTTGRCSLNMEDYWKWRKDQEKSLADKTVAHIGR
jgi:transposase-like protein